MKIEIDLEKIFVGEIYDSSGEPCGRMDFNEAIKVAVVQQLVASIGYDTRNQIRDSAKDMVAKVVADQLEKAMPDILDHKYVETDGYGREKGEWTIRSKIISEVEKQCQFKSGNYSSDRNVFTSKILDCAEKEFSKFKEEFKKQMDQIFMEKVMQHATDEIKKKLGFKS